MYNFAYSSKMDGDILVFKITGFTLYRHIVPAKERIVDEIQAMDDKGRPYKILFDLRGLKALEPRAIEAIKELDKEVFHCKAVKIATVLDSIIAKLQHMRVAKEYRMPNADLFGNYDEAIAWLNE